MDIIVSTLLFLLIINIIAFIHEFGHFWPAIKSGVRVSEFGFGYPPRILGIWKEDGKFKTVWGNGEVKTDKTVFSVNWLPLGAFNNIKSSRDRGVESGNDPLDFDTKSLPKRFLIILGGIIANFLFGVALFYFILAHYGFVFYQSMPFEHNFLIGNKASLPLVIDVDPFSPSSVAGLKTGDVVIASGDLKFETIEGFITFLNANKDEMVPLSLHNIIDNTDRTVKIMPDSKRPKEKGLIGAGLSRVVKLDYTNQKLFSGISHSINFIDYNFSALGMLFSKAINEGKPELITQNVVGPVGIAAMVKSIAPSGPWKLLELTALISLIIGCMNILPIPAFDGGRLVFLTYEAITKKKPSLELEHRVNTYGFIILVILGLLVIVKDIFQFKDLFLSK